MTTAPENMSPGVRRALGYDDTEENLAEDVTSLKWTMSRSMRLATMSFKERKAIYDTLSEEGKIRFLAEVKDSVIKHLGGLAEQVKKGK